MAVEPTLTIGYESAEGSGGYTGATDFVFPLSVSWGNFPLHPAQMNVAGSGELLMFYDNSSSDFPHSEPSTDVRGGGTGDRYRLQITYGTDTLTWIGRVNEWYPYPGLADERITEVVCRDYLHDMTLYRVNQLSPQAGLKADGVPLSANGLMQYIVSDSDYGSTDAATMPYEHLMIVSGSGETFTIAFHDLQDGETPVKTAVHRLAQSEWAHVFQDPSLAYPLRYITNNDWINLGTNIGTLDNQFVNLEIGKTRNVEYAPIFVSYYPSEVAASAVVLYSYPDNLTIKAGGTKNIRVNYRDPSQKDARVAVIDTDITTPVDATDYVYSGVPSSDLAVTFTNYGSAGLYSLTNNGGASVTFTTLQVRGKPIYLYDRATVATTDGNPSARSLKVDLKYQDDINTAEAVMNHLNRTFGTYPLNNVVESISFVPTVDSDTMTIAIKGTPGKLVTLIEDVNGINEEYRILGARWDFFGLQNAVVTWDVIPNNYISQHMVDSNSEYFVDSNGARFAFWR